VGDRKGHDRPTADVHSATRRTVRNADRVVALLERLLDEFRGEAIRSLSERIAVLENEVKRFGK
jgi:hypothetical protein